MKYSGREKTLMAATVTVIAAALLLVGIIEPQREEHQALGTRLNELELKVLKINQDLSVRHHIERKHEALVSLLSASEDAASGPQGFARQINALCREQGLKMRSLQALPSQDQQAYRVLSLKLDLQGYIDQILHFIHAVEQSKSPIRIVRLDLETRNIVDLMNASLVVSKVVVDTACWME